MNYNIGVIGITDYIPSLYQINSIIKEICGCNYRAFLKRIFESVELNRIRKISYLGNSLLNLVILDSLSKVVYFDENNETFINALADKRITNNFLLYFYDILEVDNLFRNTYQYTKDMNKKKKANIIEYLIYCIYDNYGYKAITKFVNYCIIPDILYISQFKNGIKKSYTHFYTVGYAVCKYILQKAIFNYNTKASHSNVVKNERWSVILNEKEEEIKDFYMKKICKKIKVNKPDNIYIFMGNIQYQLGTEYILNCSYKI